MFKAKIATIGLSVALGLSMVAPASAVTVAELQAQINALMAQLSSLQGGTGVTNAISSDLTVGSSGNSVVVLQQALVAQGYLVMPAGVSMGYFGSLTKAAVMKWQAANGVPATGYFGPISRAKFNGSAGATGTVPGTTVGGTVGGTISTPGVEGTITVTKNPSPASGTKVYEGASKVEVLGIKIEAKTSDMKIERVKLDLDETGDTANSDSEFYRKFAKKIYVMDGSTVLASMDLNANTVVEESNEVSITLAGLSYVVPKNTTKVLTVAIDVHPSWDSTYDADTWTVGVPVDGIRSVDGAGVNQYGPSSGNAFSNSITSEGELSASATLTVSTNANTPADMEVVAAQGTSENELDGLELLRADFKAEKDNVTIEDLVVDVVRTGSGGATTTTGYLYAGSTLIASDAIDTDGHAGFTFSDINYVVPKDSTRTLTLKVDVDSAATTATIFTADIDTNDVTAENAAGDGITESGSAQGESVTVRSVGLEISLVSKTITKGSTPSQSNTSTSTAEATFVLRLKAVGGDIKLGENASTTGELVTNDGNGASATAPSFLVYRGGTDVTSTLAVSSTTGFTIPTNGTTADGSNTRKLAEGTTIDIPVSFLFEGRTTAGALVTTGSYSVQLGRINWVSSAGLQGSTFMSEDLGWRTASVSLP